MKSNRMKRIVAMAVLGALMLCLFPSAFGAEPPAKKVNVTSVSAPAIATVGVAVTLTASLSYEGAEDESVPSGGRVSFQVNGATVSADVYGTPSSVTASWTPASAGSYTVTASYVPGGGDPFAAGSSANAAVTVNEAPVQTKTITDSMVSLNASYEYTGSQIQPAVTVVYEGNTLQSGTDYTVSYGTNLTVTGGGSVTVNGINAYTGSVTKNFAITQKNITACTVDNIPPQTWTGAQIAPEITVWNGSVKLMPTQDYSIVYGNNIGPGDAAGSVTISGMNNYTGQKTVNFNIVQNVQPKSIADCTVEAILDQAYTGQGITPKPVVKDAGATLVEGTHYTLSYSNNINPGQATITITGMGNYTGQKTVTFNIVQNVQPKPIADCTAEAIPNQSYTGQDVTPKPVLRDGATVLTEGTHYSLSYANNKNIGQATITVTGKGSYTGTKTVTFNIDKATPTVSLSYTGGQAGGEVILNATVKMNGVDVNEGAVTLWKNGVSTGATVNVVNGIASFKPANVANNDRFTVVFAGTNFNGATSNEVTIVIGKVNPNAGFTVSEGIVGAPVTLTVKVTPPLGGAMPTGTVQFWEGNVSLGTATMANGAASLTLYSVSRGQHTYTAQYSGDGNYNASGKLTQTIYHGMWTPDVVLTARGGVNGTRAELFVRVSGVSGGQRPTGQVTFWSGSMPLYTTWLDKNGEASFVWNSPPYGSYKVVATYQGDSVYAPKQSNEIAFNGSTGERVIPYVTLKAKSSSNGKNATLTATVTAGRFSSWKDYSGYGNYWYVQPTGMVNFYNGEKLLGSVKLTDGVAEFTWKNVPNGTHTLYAVYYGDYNFYNASGVTKYTKKATSSSGSSTGTGTSAATGNVTNIQTTVTDYRHVALRNEEGHVLETFDTNQTAAKDGILALQTSQSADFYSFGFSLARLQELSSGVGSFQLVTPTFNFVMPYTFAKGLEGLDAFIAQNGLSQSKLELRVNIRRVTDSGLASALTSAYPGERAVTDFYRVEFALYSEAGVRLNFVPSNMAEPAQLLLPVTGQVLGGLCYDEQARSFASKTVDYATNAAVITVDQNGVYVVTNGGMK